MLIGFSGLARSGKDTAGEVLKKMGYKHLSFAGELKKIALNINPLLSYRTQNIRLSELQLVGGWDLVKSLPWDEKGGAFGGATSGGPIPPGRKFLLDLGTEICRVFGPSALAKTVRLELPLSYVTDVRREEELYLIRRHNGINVFIERPGIEPVAGHELEDGRLKDLADKVIVNEGTVEQLHFAVLEVIATWTGRPLR